MTHVVHGRRQLGVVYTYLDPLTRLASLPWVVTEIRTFLQSLLPHLRRFNATSLVAQLLGMCFECPVLCYMPQVSRWFVVCNISFSSIACHGLPGTTLCLYQSAFPVDGVWSIRWCESTCGFCQKVVSFFCINKHQKLRIQNQMLKITNPFANLEGANVWLFTKALRLNSFCIPEICQLQPSICHLLS